jgi:hypothetical protein
MKLELTEIQKHKILEAYRNASDVLREIKLKTLKDDALKDMKILEDGVSHIECFLLGK